MPSRIAVLVAASGAVWEAAALQELGSAGPGVVLLKRCVDLPDLLASAMTGQAHVALVAGDLPGLDSDSVAHLHRCGLGVVMVAEQVDIDRGDEQRLRRLGAEQLLAAPALADLRDAVTAAGAEPVADDPGVPDHAPVESADPTVARTVAVWGPAGAPGRTTVAVTVAAELADRGTPTFLVDADPYGGAVAQHLGVLDEVSGLLAAARMANAGQLDRERLATCARQVAANLRVLTGLPRADRWTESRQPVFEQILDLGRALGREIVVDTGFCLEEDASAGYGSPTPQRNAMTLSALERADQVIAVGSADPVGLSRLARGLVELVDAVPGCAVRVVVNRMRGTLGWTESEITEMLEEFVTAESVHFLPDDRAACDRAMVAGKSLVELGDTPVRRGIALLVDAVTGAAQPARRSGLFRRA